MEQFEVKLEAGDTREALLQKKLRAEMSFRQVSEDYHVVWLNCREHSKSALKDLEALTSLNLQDKITQPPAAGVASNTPAYMDWLYASLGRLAPKFQQLLQNLGKATGIEIKHAPLKAKKRVLEKAFYDYQGDYSRLVDICRGSGVADDLEGVVRAMKWILSGQCQVSRFKNRFCDGRKDIMARGGYRDILINLELPNGAGFVFELQIHLRPLYAMKEEAHKVLDLARAIIEPTLLKLSLLDSQDSHAQLVQRIKELELQVSGLTIETAVNQGNNGNKNKNGNGSSDKSPNTDQEWKRKYEKSQQNCLELEAQGKQKDAAIQELQRKCSQLETEGKKKDGEIQELRQKCTNLERKCEATLKGVGASSSGLSSNGKVQSDVGLMEPGSSDDEWLGGERDVEKYLRDIGLMELFPKFAAENVDMYELRRFTKEDFAGMGVKIGPAIKILATAKTWKAQ